ncbi:MAG: hypothetical protein KL785_07555 [Brevundimonas sp.]|nr:hypothetical protein [Brevundimonas sp.]
MVGVVEQQGEAAAALAGAPDGGDERRLVPLVNDDQIGAVQRLLQLRLVETPAGQVRIGPPVRLQPGLAVVGDQVGAAPGVARLVHGHVVTPRDQVAQHAAQEMGVAVVPARLEGVGEIDDLHAAASAKGARAARASP